MKALLLPGLDGHHVLYESFEAELQRHGVQAVRGSLPRSSAPSYGDLARDVVVPKEPFVLVAESFSGPLAVALAHRHTSLVKALVLISTFLTCPLPLLPWLAPTLPSALFRIAPPAPLLRWSMLGLDAPDGAVNALAQAIADTPPEVTRHRIRLVAAVDMKGAFQALTLPTLSLRARGDRLVPEAAQRAMANLRRSLEAITLDGPHLLLQRNPEGTARAIGAFLQRTVSGT